MNKIFTKFLGITLSATMFFLPLMSTSAFAVMNTNTSKDITIMIDGEELKTENKPFIYNERTLLPLRAVSESLGYDVEWNQENQRVNITNGDRKLTVFIDNKLLFYTTEEGEFLPGVMDVAPEIRNERTYVPVRVVANCLGLEVVWNQDTYTVELIDTGKGEFEPFYDIGVVNLSDGDTFTRNTTLVLENTSGVSADASQIRYLYLDKTTGKGKVVAACNYDENYASLMPDMEYYDNGVFAATVVDGYGNFLAGCAYDVSFKVQPSVQIVGVSENEIIGGRRSITVEANFAVDHIIYEFDYANASAADYVSDSFDLATAFPFSPPKSKNGGVTITATAYDTNGNGYAAEPVNAIVNISDAEATVPYLYLKYINEDYVGEIPVALSVSRNYDASRTVYYAENVNSGKIVVLEDTNWGDYSWFPGPDMKGDWNIYAKTTDTSGYIRKSNVRTVTVLGKERIIIKGVGPDEVITDVISVNSAANVKLTSINYVLSNPVNFTEKSLGSFSDVNSKAVYTPISVNEGYRDIQAIAVTEDGNTIYSEKVRVKIYLGETFGSKPITDKTNFINFVSDYAVSTQKKTGMAASIQIAQAVLETGWGQYVPVDRYSGTFSNNLFGIKGSGSAGSVLCATREVYNGITYYIDDYFRAYKNASESWSDHQNLLLLLPRYEPYRDVMYDYSKAAKALKSCGYATDPNYANTLIFLVEKYELWQYDIQGI